MDKRAHVRILYSKKCPNAAPTADLVEKIGNEIGVPLEIEKILVTSREEAAELRCLGSPTVQVNGLDIDPGARNDTRFLMG
jgi:hypothetical protein